MIYRVQSPLSIYLSKKSKFILNLNNYRNTHYFKLNQAKRLYKETVLPQLEQLPTFHHIKLKYIYYPPNKRKCDIANICSIVDKFFCDALVETGHLEDDNYDFIPSVLYCFGEVDKENPRIEIEIEELS